MITSVWFAVLTVASLASSSLANEECHCTAAGDPHYRSFDGTTFDFMGKCKYVLAESVEQGMECSFIVNAINVDRGQPHVSYTNALEIKFMDHLFRMDQGNQLVVDGQTVRSRAVTEGDNVQVQMCGNWLTLHSPKCGLRVEFDGLWTAFVKLKIDKHKGKVRGLCGNCNGNPGDDFQPKTGGGNAANVQVFANTFITHDEGANRAECKVERVPDPEPHPCRGEWERNTRQMKYCGAFLVDTRGPFERCIRSGKVNVDMLYDSCRYDICMNKDNERRINEIRCEALKSFVLSCAEKGITGIDWRAKCGCEMRCPGRQIYKMSIEPCPASCDSRRKEAVCSKDLKEKEGCGCPDGTVQFGTECVTQDKCPPNKEVTLSFKRLKQRKIEQTHNLDKAVNQTSSEEATFGENGQPLTMKRTGTNSGHHKENKSNKEENTDLTEANFDGNGDFFGGASDFMKNFGKMM